MFAHAVARAPSLPCTLDVSSVGEIGNDALGRALGDIQQVEMELRRKVDEANGGNIRSAGNEPVPPGYEDKVADYFRKLSKSK